MQPARTPSTPSGSPPPPPSVASGSPRRSRGDTPLQQQQRPRLVNVESPSPLRSASVLDQSSTEDASVVPPSRRSVVPNATQEPRRRLNQLSVRHAVDERRRPRQPASSSPAVPRSPPGHGQSSPAVPGSSSRVRKASTSFASISPALTIFMQHSHVPCQRRIRAIDRIPVPIQPTAESTGLPCQRCAKRIVFFHDRKNFTVEEKAERAGDGTDAGRALQDGTLLPMSLACRYRSTHDCDHCRRGRKKCAQVSQ